MLISPIKAMTGTELQRLQQRRKQVLFVGIAIGVALLAITDFELAHRVAGRASIRRGMPSVFIVACSPQWCAPTVARGRGTQRVWTS